MKLDEDVFGKPTSGVDAEIFTSRPAVPMRAAPEKYVPQDGFFRSTLIGAGRTFDKLGAGAQQLYYGITGNEDKLSALRQDQAEKDRLYAPLQQARPWATGIGETLPAMAVPVGGAGASAANLAARAGLGQAAIGAAEYGSVGERLGKGATQGLGGAAGALAGRGIGNLTNAAVTGKIIQKVPTAAQANAAKVLDAAGVPMSIGERTGQRFARGIEDAAAVIPVTSTAVQAQKEAQQMALNQAAAKLAGVQGAVANITPDIADAARKGAGRVIGDIAERNTMKVDAETMRALLALRNSAADSGNDMVGKVINKRVDQFIQKISMLDDGSAAVSGKQYREFQSQVGKQANSASGDVAAALGELRDIVRSGMNSSIPKAEQKAWAKANETYRNAIALQEAAARSSAGDVTPAALFQASKKAPESMRSLGAAANTMIKPLPSSGTAERAYMQRLLTDPLATVAQTSALGPVWMSQKILNAASNNPNGWLNIDPRLLAMNRAGFGLGGGLFGAALPAQAYGRE